MICVSGATAHSVLRCNCRLGVEVFDKVAIEPICLFYLSWLLILTLSSLTLTIDL